MYEVCSLELHSLCVALTCALLDRRMILHQVFKKMEGTSKKKKKEVAIYNDEVMAQHKYSILSQNLRHYREQEQNANLFLSSGLFVTFFPTSTDGRVQYSTRHQN